MLACALPAEPPAARSLFLHSHTATKLVAAHKQATARGKHAQQPPHTKHGQKTAVDGVRFHPRRGKEDSRTLLSSMPVSQNETNCAVATLLPSTWLRSHIAFSIIV